jgi:hypothetical protein
MSKDTWTKIRRLLSRAIKGAGSEGVNTGLPAETAHGAPSARPGLPAGVFRGRLTPSNLASAGPFAMTGRRCLQDEEGNNGAGHREVVQRR